MLPVLGLLVVADRLGPGDVRHDHVWVLFLGLHQLAQVLSKLGVDHFRS